MRRTRITFAGFLLFSVMPRNCVVEIEIGGAFGHAERIEMRTARKNVGPALSRTKVRGNDDDLRFRDGNENAQNGSRLSARYDDPRRIV